MGYYGDYYGDYYRGDPGIFGFLGKVAKTAVRVVGGAGLGFLTGGPKGAITGAITGAAAATGANIRSDTMAAGGSQTAYTPAMRRSHSLALARGPVSSNAMMSSKAARIGYGGAVAMGAGGGGRRRRMNWANGKALGRAERRIRSAVKHFSHYMRWVHPGKIGHVVPKIRGKR